MKILRKIKNRLTYFILRKVVRLDMSAIARVHATLIVAGALTFSEVLDCIKEQVKEILVALGVPELAVEEEPEGHK